LTRRDVAGIAASALLAYIPSRHVPTEEATDRTYEEQRIQSLVNALLEAIKKGVIDCGCGQDKGTASFQLPVVAFIQFHVQ
jgi:hypothetical protein